MNILKTEKKLDYNSENKTNMKKTINSMLKVLIMAVMVSMSWAAAAQNPPPPPGGSGGSNNTSGNSQGAPLNGELIFFVGIGLAYGGLKIYKIKKADKLKQLQ